MLCNPIFIIGTERSGSNLLRLLLDAHSEIAIPHPTHMMRDLAPFADSYGDLEDEQNFKQMIADVVSVANTHFMPWPFEIKEEEIFEKVESRSLYGIYAALQDLYLQHTGKKRWGCKSTFMWQQIEEIVHHHKEPKMIHLVRDPRDVAVSARKSIFSKYHPYKQAELWSKEQGEIESWGEKLGAQYILCVRYEDLTGDPGREMRRIMAFLNEDFQPDQLSYFHGEEASKLSKLSESWKNCSRPVNNQSVGRYRGELSSQEIGWIEYLCGDLMKKYGYPTEAPSFQEHPSAAELLKIESLEKWRKLETESKALFKDQNFSLRWKKWFHIQFLRRARSRMNG